MDAGNSTKTSEIRAAAKFIFPTSAWRSWTSCEPCRICLG